MTVLLRLSLLAALAAGSGAFVPRPSFGGAAARCAGAASSASSPTARFVAIDTSDIKNGLTVEIDGDPHKVLAFSVMKQARGAAKTTIKFKNLARGNTIENTYRSGEKFETAQIERKDVIYSYQDELNFYFMDAETFEEMPVDAKVVGDRAQWIGEGSPVTLVQFKDRVIEVTTPSPAVYTVAETEPSIKGNTAQGHTKPAVLDCGATITVPGYIEIGQKVKVNTDEGIFMERVTE